MRGIRVALISTSVSLALLSVMAMLLLAVSREINAPAGMQTGLWGPVLVAGLGVAGAVLLRSRLVAAIVVFGGAAFFVDRLLPPSNWFLVTTFGLASLAAFAALLVDSKLEEGRTDRPGAQRSRSDLIQ
ncbi:Hypothetical Protein RradSPS_1277 [Rubrobacter radiotolerans]|uniref:Uncharacterized protein n=1 Tax=Rubrobacter radiotolerans TaxID=42256 RepID=A0A023X3J5_RUBRA|nr:hypothetical protein [Rubrobacter radiotolerans]AHY46560.1 Hypothetical Protein RradSPS_1277 [Rubrobacter radiotolerans]MDX5893967.1 hypothetical protein [Rubrobacter radiotolerans]SMC04869.1 hypothetical protein SAMN00767673_1276 [Rubrobacter radiotolerans DSM 5868]